MPNPNAILAWCAAPAAAAALLGAVPRTPLWLYNGSPSLPTGLYRRVGSDPRAGDVVAFKIPAPGRAYAAAHLPLRLRTSLLKPVAAGPGAQACVLGGWLILDGRAIGAALRRDRRGDPLPRWSGCARLRAGQLIVASRRIPNSFDSRYFGPIRDQDVLGVYKLALAWPPQR